MPTIEINLNDTETKILEYSANGLTAADIAQSLNLPQRNIEEKLRVLKYKFSSKNKPEMLVKATKIGIIPD